MNAKITALADLERNRYKKYLKYKMKYIQLKKSLQL
jgi:hypothetical protein